MFLKKSLQGRFGKEKIPRGRKPHFMRVTLYSSRQQLAVFMEVMGNEAAKMNGFKNSWTYRSISRITIPRGKKRPLKTQTNLYGNTFPKGRI